MSVGAVVPRLAATVVLVREGTGGLEVLLTRRPATMAFAPDVFVFPGGRVDDTDRSADLAARSVRSADEAEAALGGDLDAGAALAAHVAAIRELFEEAGVLLADAVAWDGKASHRAARAARTALVGGEVSFGDLAADLGLRLRTDLLVPLSRWVTPPTLPRRFDARFFAAGLPSGASVSFEGDEVADHRWSTPSDALTAMADGSIGMWLPTSATLQQLQHARSLDEVRAHATPGPLGGLTAERISSVVTRITMPAGGGVAGQPIHSYLVGRERYVVIDPGDPTGPGLERAIELARDRGGRIEAVAITQSSPDHAGGVEALAEMLDIPVFGSPHAGRQVPYDVRPLPDGDLVPAGDVPMRAIATPGRGPDHLAFVVEDAGGSFAITGDLDGRVGARSIPAPVDAEGVSASRARLAALVPEDRWLPGHPPGR